MNSTNPARAGTGGPGLAARPAPLNISAVVRALAFSAGAAIVANVLLLAAWRWLFGISPEFQPLAIGPQATFTLLAALGGVLTLVLLIRYARRPARLFFLISAVVFALSFIPVWLYAIADPPNPGVSAGTLAVLCVTHVVALLCIVPVQVALLVPSGDARSQQ